MNSISTSYNTSYNASGNVDPEGVAADIIRTPAIRNYVLRLAQEAHHNIALASDPDGSAVEITEPAALSRGIAQYFVSMAHDEIDRQLNSLLSGVKAPPLPAVPVRAPSISLVTSAESPLDHSTPPAHEAEDNDDLPFEHPDSPDCPATASGPQSQSEAEMDKTGPPNKRIRMDKHDASSSQVDDSASNSATQDNVEITVDSPNNKDKEKTTFPVKHYVRKVTFSFKWSETTAEENSDQAYVNELNFIAISGMFTLARLAASDVCRELNSALKSEDDLNGESIDSMAQTACVLLKLTLQATVEDFGEQLTKTAQDIDKSHSGEKEHVAVSQSIAKLVDNMNQNIHLLWLKAATEIRQEFKSLGVEEAVATRLTRDIHEKVTNMVETKLTDGRVSPEKAYYLKK